MAKTYTTAEIAELLKRVSNWGRWGREDQRGALNYISNEKRAGAARLVRSGETVSLALPLATRPSPDNPAPVTHLMIRSGNVGHPLGSWGCADYFAIEPHGLATTHLDALCHHFYQGKMYNGFDYTEVDFQGAHKCAIDVLSRARAGSDAGRALRPARLRKFSPALAAVDNRYHR